MSIAHEPVRDIKPGNLIVKEGSAAKITDFGLSIRVSKRTPYIVTGSEALGTLAYISPEQTGRMSQVELLF